MTYSVTDVISYLSQGRPGGVEAISYVLRTCSQNMTAYGGFLWPRTGPVEAPDWNPEPECGGGLHGLLRGEGDTSHLNLSGIWQVCAVWSTDVVDLGGKCKFPRAWVVLSGNKDAATSEMVRLGYTLCVYATVTGGDDATLTGGYRATVTGGVGATVTGGDFATVTGGYRATVTGGYDATVTGGDNATVTGGLYSRVSGGLYSRVSGGYRATVTGGDGARVTGGYGATVTGGDFATVTGGNRATVTGGDFATVTGGYYSRVCGGDYATVTGGRYSTVTGGANATVTGGYGARVTGGEGSTLLLCHYDDQRRKRIVTAYVGENDIKPATAYRLVDGVFTEVPEEK